ncbi:MAG: hypothetical protein PQJ59_11335 [Spirochaetales bacterium]|nr:hypothetical protein [Spirochaetales bacterium]
MFKFEKMRDKMTFTSLRPKLSKKLSSWEIERVKKIVPELKNPCVNEWTLNSLPSDLMWLVTPSFRRLEIMNKVYTIYWEDGYSRNLNESESREISEYLKHKTTFRQNTIEYRDLPKGYQAFWDKR